MHEETAVGDLLIEKVVTRLIAEIQEIVKSKAQALCANSICAYKVDISKVSCKSNQDYSSKKVFVLISAMGDAVTVEPENK